MGVLLTILFFLLSVLAVSLRKFYRESPVIEPHAGQSNPVLRRRTIKSTKREHTLSGTLVLLSVISFSLFAAVGLAYLPAIGYFLVLALALFFVFFYLPSKNSGRLITQLASFLTPVFIALLSKTKHQTKALEKRLSDLEKAKNINKHLTKAEIAQILDQQKANYEGRSLAHGLQMAINSLDFGAGKIENFMLPLADVHLVGDKETAGPILIDELHKSGYRIFPLSNKDEGIIGTVRLADLVDLSDGGKKVGDVANDDLPSLNTSDNPARAFSAFQSSGALMFIVKDGKENVGILYLEDLLSQLIVDG